MFLAVASVPVPSSAIALQEIGRDGVIRPPEARVGPIFVPEATAKAMLTKRIAPEYSAAARAEGIEGDVVIKVVVGKDGRVIQATIISGPITLREAARDAVMLWEYKPFLLNNTPVEFETRTRLHFSLRRRL